MKYFKKWMDNPERLKEAGEPIGWFEVTQKDTIMHLTGNVREYGGVDSTPEQIEEKLLRGDILRSSAAMYIAVKEIVIYQYDNARNIMTDGQRWFMYYRIAEKKEKDFNEIFSNFQKYGKKSWALGELRDYGTKVEKEGNDLLFHTDGYSTNNQCAYRIKDT